LGHGADEQMAGYGRHRVSWIKGDYISLNNELNIDISRLWVRNLGL
jgi:hypothetical protein